MNEAQVEVLCVRIDPASTILPSEQILTKERHEHLGNEAAEWAAAVNRVYNAWLDDHPDWVGRTSWSDPVSTIRHQVRLRGSGADLIVVPSPARPWDPDSQALRTAMFEANRPVLVIPNTLTWAIGRSIAIIWDEEQPTVRAVLDAMPLLARARKLFVLSTTDLASNARSHRLPQVLIDHGVDAEVQTIQPARPIGKALRERTYHLGVDLVVMGAYAHHPLIELMIGGLTRFMLSHADLPVLMRH